MEIIERIMAARHSRMWKVTRFVLESHHMTIQARQLGLHYDV
jgi:hypothetical protein